MMEMEKKGDQNVQSDDVDQVRPPVRATWEMEEENVNVITEEQEARSASLTDRISRLLSRKDVNNTNESPKQRQHYRRGTILLNHLKTKQKETGATEKEQKFFETIKRQFESNLMESRTVISLSVFQTGSNLLDDPFAVIHMPVEIQQGFRRKLFMLFTLQLFTVVALLTVFRSVDPFESWFESTFAGDLGYLFGAFAIMIAGLLALYLLKYRYPWNFIVLVIYTLFQSVFFAGCDAYFDANATAFISCILLGIMGLTTVLCTITRTKIQPSQPIESTKEQKSNHEIEPNAVVQMQGSEDEHVEDEHSVIQETLEIFQSSKHLITYPALLLTSYTIVAIVALIIYFTALEGQVTTIELAISLGGTLLLVMWFSYDALCMNERLSPDEYMQGMVFFYTDMVLFLFFLSIVLVACFACEGDCACYGTADIAPMGARPMDGADVDFQGGELGNLDGLEAGDRDDQQVDT